MTWNKHDRQEKLSIAMRFNVIMTVLPAIHSFTLYWNDKPCINQNLILLLFLVNLLLVLLKTTKTRALYITFKYILLRNPYFIPDQQDRNQNKGGVIWTQVEHVVLGRDGQYAWKLDLAVLQAFYVYIQKEKKYIK